ncbi:MAG: hypothetical protein AAFZ15_11555 [Bacteroidota bacterium]
MTNFLLKFISLFNPFWRKVGADVEQLNAILEAKLKMDARRTSPMGRGFNQKNKNKNNNDVGIIMANLFMGIFAAILIPYISDKTSALTIYFSMWMVFLAMTIITDFTDVLIDVRDNYIILPKPVNDRTVTLSRVLHIFLYLSKQVVFFILPGIVALVFIQPAGIPVFLLQCLLTCVMVVIFVNAFYLLMLRVTTPSRFKDIINYFQIAFSVLIFGSYYMLPRIMDMTDMKNIDVLSTPLMYIAPSTWVASFWELLADFNFSMVPIVLSLTALVFTFLGAYLVSTVLAKNLNQKMMAIAQGGGASKKNKISTPKKDNKWLPLLSGKMTSSIAENAAFQFTWAQISRNRDYKLKTYPSLAFIPILFVYFGIDGEGALSERFAELQSGDKYLVLIYICMLMIAAPVMNAVYSDKAKASWLFWAAPVERPGEIVLGTVKAVFVKYILPIYLLMMMVGLGIWGGRVLDDFLFGFVVMLLFTTFSIQLFFNKMPFSVDWADYNKGGNFATTIILMLVISVIGGVHYFLIDKTIWMMLVGMVLAVVAFALYLSVQRMGWGRFNH